MKINHFEGFACRQRIEYFLSMNPRDPIVLLFVDHDTSYMAVAQHLLTKYQARKFSILWRQDGPSALEMLQKRTGIHMLIVDYYLPEMNGLDFIRELKARNIDIPAIFLTSGRDFRIAIEAMRLGVEDFLVKAEAVDSVLPRTIVNILDRVHLKQRIAQQQHADLIARKQTDAIKELVVTVCHEFNNPLAAIKISSDILRRNKLTSDDARRVDALAAGITAVEREINRLRDINFERADRVEMGR
jgi:FixJ family two-component response regulator